MTARGGVAPLRPYDMAGRDFRCFAAAQHNKGSRVMADRQLLIQPPLHLQVINFFKVGILSCYN